MLYGGRWFRCRRCYQLKYSSQYEPAHGRALSRAQRNRQRLGGSGSLDKPFPPKPRFMHWATYERLEDLVGREPNPPAGAYSAHALSRIFSKSYGKCHAASARPLSYRLARLHSVGRALYRLINSRM